MNQDLMVFFSRDNLSKIKDGAYVRNLYEYYDTGTHWVAFYVQNDDVTCSLNNNFNVFWCRTYSERN